MNKTLTRSSAAAASAAVLLLTMSSAALAASTWSSQSGCTVPTGTGNSISCNNVLAGGDAVTATITAWSTAGTTPNPFKTAEATRYLAGTNFLGGFGVVNQGTNPVETGTNGEHSIDNVSGTDVLLVKFSADVVLSALTIGWKYTDSDVTILRYVGSGTPTMLSGLTTTDVKNDIANAGSGWDLVGNYSDLVEGTAKSTGTSKSSSWWLISAYNSTYGGGTLTTGDDYFKLLSFAGNKVTAPSGVPEPGSLALAAVALLGVAGSRRKLKQPSV